MKYKEPDFIFETEKPTVQQERKQAIERLNTQNLSQVMRGAGALIIIVSAATLLFKHWTPGSDLQRYLFLLGFTSILSVSGLICGLSLKESKGARTLLGLTLAVTPINFAVMGALLYSKFSWDGALSHLPNYATWVASSPTMALLATLGGLAILAPLGHFSFLTLSHKQAKLFTGAFLISNMALLLPTRQPNVIAVLFILLVALLTFMEVRTFSCETSLRTFGGYLSRALIWVPVAILIGRGCYFYTPSQLFVSVILFGVAALSFGLLPQLTSCEKWQKALQVCGTVIAGAAWINTAEILLHTPYIGTRHAILIGTLPLAGLLCVLAKYSVGTGNNYRNFAAIIAVLGAGLNLLAHANFGATIICLAISAVVVVFGFLLEQKTIFVSGTLGVLLAIGYQFKVVFHHFSLNNWSSLMAIGVLIIIFASIIERYNGKLRERFEHAKHQFRHWKR